MGDFELFEEVLERLDRGRALDPAARSPSRQTAAASAAPATAVPRAPTPCVSTDSTASSGDVLAASTSVTWEGRALEGLGIVIG
jgi:hypothetical protein